MKTKKMAYAVLVMSTLSVAAFSQTNSGTYFSEASSVRGANLAKAEKQYANCLKSANDGVVESALAHVALLKLMNPERDFALVAPAVDVVAGTNPSPEIRYKAYLVSNVLRNPELFSGEARTSYESPDELFSVLASRMSALIASAIGK
ncbi:MAG: hypothetical protein KF749_00690 [Bacteroidetes bacterium]|nr:hypothetical protein [Bacteroidota bacterium]MCW5895145.1 hypothetical protein [Bacteroidota bacterium]